MPWSDKDVAKLKLLGVTPEHVQAALAKVGTKGTGTRTMGNVKKLAEGGPVSDDPAFAPSIPANNFAQPLPDQNLELRAQDVAMTMGGVPAPARLAAAREKVMQEMGTMGAPRKTGPGDIIPGEGRLEQADSPNTAGVLLPPSALPAAPGADATGANFYTPPAPQAGPIGFGGKFSGNSASGGLPQAPNLSPPTKEIQAYGGALENEANVEGAGLAGIANKEVQQAHDFSVMQNLHKQAMDDSMKQEREANERAAKNPISEWGAGKKVTAAIAMVMGGLGGALTRQGGNIAVDVINKALDREIGIRGKAADRAHQTTTELRANQTADKIAGLQQAKMEIDSMMSQSKSDVVRAHGESLKAQLDVKIKEEQNALGQHNFENRAKLYHLETERGKNSAGLDAKYGQQYAKGLGVMPTEEEGKKARDFQQSRELVEGGLAQLEALRRKHPGGKIPVGPDSAAADQISKNIMLGARQGLSLGVLSDSDIRLLKEISVGDALSLTTLDSTVMAKIKGMRRNFAAQEESWRKRAMIPDGAPAPTSVSGFRPVGAK